MEKTEVKRTAKEDRYVIGISLKISPKESKFLNEHDLSPTAIFRKALKELGLK